MKTWHIIILALLVATVAFLAWRTLSMSKQFAAMRKASKQNADSKFATKPDGTPDYTHHADGTPVMFG